MTSGADALIAQAVGAALIERYMDGVEEEIRADWEKALDTMNYGAISGAIDWGFYPEDLWKLMQLHQADKHREKIEDLLTDCNFHSFCDCLSDGDYAGAEKKIREMEEED